jgi:hypothetical protein
MPLRLAEGFNHEGTKDTKAVTKNFDLEPVHEFFDFLRESFVLFATLWLNGSPPRSDPWSSFNH